MFAQFLRSRLVFLRWRLCFSRVSVLQIFSFLIWIIHFQLFRAIDLELLFRGIREISIFGVSLLKW